MELKKVLRKWITIVFSFLLLLAFSIFSSDVEDIRYYENEVLFNNQKEKIVYHLKFKKNHIKGYFTLKSEVEPKYDVNGILLSDGRIQIENDNSEKLNHPLLTPENKLDRFSRLRYSLLSEQSDQNILKWIFENPKPYKIINQSGNSLYSHHYFYLQIALENQLEHYIVKLNSKGKFLEKVKLSDFELSVNMSVKVEMVILQKKELLSVILQESSSKEIHYLLDPQTLEVVLEYNPFQKEPIKVHHKYYSNKEPISILTEYYSFLKWNILEKHVIKKKSFQVNLSYFGKSKFFTTIEEGFCPKAVFYITDKNNHILYRLPTYYGNKWCVDSIESILFLDLNEDKNKDIAIISKNYTPKEKPNTKLFWTIGIYYSAPSIGFIQKETIDESVNENCSSLEDIKEVIGCIKNNFSTSK